MMAQGRHVARFRVLCVMIAGVAASAGGAAGLSAEGLTAERIRRLMRQLEEGSPRQSERAADALAQAWADQTGPIEEELAMQQMALQMRLLLASQPERLLEPHGRLIEAVCEQLRSSEIKVRFFDAVENRAMPVFRPSVAAGCIARWLHDHDAGVRAEAARALGYARVYGSPPGVPETEDLAELLDDPDPTVQRGALCAMTVLRARIHRKKIVKLLRCGEPAVRAESVSTLAHLNARDDAPEIAKLLKDEAIANGFFWVGGKEFVNPEVRELAAQLLKDWGVAVEPAAAKER